MHFHAMPKKPKPRRLSTGAKRKAAPEPLFVPMRRAELRDLAERTAVTLDGKPARLVGWRLDFASVAPIPSGPAVPFSWHAVQRVLVVGGRFRS